MQLSEMSCPLECYRLYRRARVAGDNESRKQSEEVYMDTALFSH